jgi:hypothetical protein
MLPTFSLHQNSYQVTCSINCSVIAHSIYIQQYEDTTESELCDMIMYTVSTDFISFYSFSINPTENKVSKDVETVMNKNSTIHI